MKILNTNRSRKVTERRRRVVNPGYLFHLYSATASVGVGGRTTTYKHSIFCPELYPARRNVQRPRIIHAPEPQPQQAARARLTDHILLLLVLVLLLLL
jgi:hypothetical protein